MFSIRVLAARRRLYYLPRRHSTRIKLWYFEWSSVYDSKLYFERTSFNSKTKL